MAVSLREVVSFGRYEPLFRIASGGMAEVYAARIRGEAGFQKLVAVKRMHPHLASDSTFVDMFLNEARLAAHVASPYVVQTLDLGRGTDGSLYIVMELVVGLSLAKLQEDHPGPLPVPVAVEVIAQAAQGLDDAHEATTPAGDPLGLVHRDVSPHNVLLGLDGRARVTDFGIAHAVHRPREETNVKELKGKFPYMSPEQTRLLPLDRRSDLFSLGIVAWELLVGRRLFAEKDPTASIRNVREKIVPSPRSEAPDVPEAVADAVLTALARDPKGRFATGAEMARALRDAARASLDAQPDRKAIAAFVREAGGEELERLRRLIRLGTEGAGADAIEAVKPGATRVLARDGSGVSRVDSSRSSVARPGTEKLDDDAPLVPLVTLSAADEPDHTSTAHVIRSGEIPTDVLLGVPPVRPPPSPRPTTGRGPGTDRSSTPSPSTPSPRAERSSGSERPSPIPGAEHAGGSGGVERVPVVERPKPVRERPATERPSSPGSTGRRERAASTTPRPSARPPRPLPGPAEAETRDYRAVRAVKAAPPALDEPPTRPWQAQRATDEPPTAPPRLRRALTGRRAVAADPLPSSWKRGAIVGAIAGLVLVGAAIATWQLWPEPPERVPLPVEPFEPSPLDVAPPRAPETDPATGSERPLDRGPTRSDDGPTDDPGGDPTRGGESAPSADDATTANRARRRRPRAHRSRAAPGDVERTAPTGRTTPTERTAPAGASGPMLLDVDDFDRHR